MESSLKPEAIDALERQISQLEMEERSVARKADGKDRLHHVATSTCTVCTQRMCHCLQHNLQTGGSVLLRLEPEVR